MLNIQPDSIATLTPPEPDRGQLAVFVRTLFKHAAPGGIVSIRAFPHDRGRALFVYSFRIKPDDELNSVIDGATRWAREAAKVGGVFSPPVATFKKVYKATESNLAEGFAVTVECDEYPQQALAKLSELIGPPTMIVESGGRWANPETGKDEPKLHLHWRLTVPARDPDSLARLKKARAFATAIVGSDPTNVPINHPLRWPGSWHLKNPANPRPCWIVDVNENEIDLDTVYDILRDAAPAVDVAKAEKLKHARSGKASERLPRVCPLDEPWRIIAPYRHQRTHRVDGFRTEQLPASGSLARME